MVKPYKVVLEIEINANSPLQAAEIVEEWIQERGSHWQYYVQSYDDDQIYSIDLEEDDINKVLDIDKYVPLI